MGGVGPFRSYRALKAYKTADFTTRQQFQQFWAPGRLVLLRWCACHFAWFWGLLFVRSGHFSRGSVLDFGGGGGGGGGG